MLFFAILTCKGLGGLYEACAPHHLPALPQEDAADGLCRGVSGSLTCCKGVLHDLAVFPGKLKGIAPGPVWSAQHHIIKVPAGEGCAQTLRLVGDEAYCDGGGIVFDCVQHLHDPIFNLLLQSGETSSVVKRRDLLVPAPGQADDQTTSERDTHENVL